MLSSDSEFATLRSSPIPHIAAQQGLTITGASDEQRMIRERTWVLAKEPTSHG